MKHIGHIDKNKLGILMHKILTSKVIITNERIEHINKRHPGDYEKYIDYIPNILNTPDYILEDNNNNDTIFILKTFPETNNNIKIVIKLHTNNQEQDRYNSIITFWHIRDRNYKNSLKSNKIIYNKFDNNV